MLLTELSQSKRDLVRFCRLPYAIYRGDPHWVAPLLLDLYKALAPANPFFQHARIRFWVASRDGQDIGRIAGIVDDHHNQRHHDQAAFFGFFECIDDPAVAAALMQAVADWARSQGLTRLLGPMSPSTNDECGLLVEGFDGPPRLLMPHNPRYYPALLEGTGCVKIKDLVAFRGVIDNPQSDRVERMTKLILRRDPSLRLRNIRRRTLRADLAKVKAVYNDAWADNWGFVPLTEAEIDFMAARLKPLMDERLLVMVESGDNPLAFALCLPDFNQALAPLRGRLFSPGLLRALPYFLGWKVTEYSRLMAMGVRQSHRLRGLEMLLLDHLIRQQKKIGIRYCEISWILEDNEPALRVADTFSGDRYRRYRLYQRPV